MQSTQAQQFLEKRIAHIDLRVQTAVDAMLDLYRNERADDCSIEEDGDMLLFQWGTYDWGEGRFFEVDLTRQFITTGVEDDDEIWQLSLNLKFLPNDETAKLGAGDRWCQNPSSESINSFEDYIKHSEVYSVTSNLKPDRVDLDYDNAE